MPHYYLAKRHKHKKHIVPIVMFPSVLQLSTADGECTPTTEFRIRLNKGQAIGASLQKIWKSHNILISRKIRPMKTLVWPVATYGCESWTLRKNEETRIDTFEMKGLRKIMLVSWTAKKTNEWVLNKAGVMRELLDTVKARKLAYYGNTMKTQGSCLEKQIMQGTMPGARRRGRPRTAWMDNMKTWTGLPAEESIRMTEDRDKWRKYVYGVANRRIEDGYRTEHNNSRCSRCLLQPLCPSVTLLLKNIQSVTPRVYALKYRSQ